MFQDKYYVPLVIAVHAAILLPIGLMVGDVWGVLLLGGLMRLILSHHVTFFINSLCHMWGIVHILTKILRVTILYSQSQPGVRVIITTTTFSSTTTVTA